MNYLWQLLYSTIFLATTVAVLLSAIAILFIKLLIVTAGQRKAALLATERAAQVHEVNRQLQQTLGAIHAQVWYLDTETRVVDYNRFAKEFLAMAPLQARGRPMMALLPSWHDPQLAEQRNEQVIATGEKLLGTLESYEQAGETYWITVDRLPSFDEQGEIDGMMLFMYDITPLKQVEKALRLQKTILEAQSETSLDGILLLSSEHSYLSVNKRFIDLWQLPSAVVVEKSPHKFFEYINKQLADAAPFQQWMATFESNSSTQASDLVQLQDGRIFDWYSSPITGENGQHYGRVWYFRDLTETRRTEEALRVAHAELELHVHDRTAELRKINAQLQQEVEERTRVEKALRASEERMEFALFGADLGLIDIDLQTGKAIYNERWAEIRSFPLDQYIDTMNTWMTSIHPDDRQSVSHALENHLRGDLPFFEQEYRVKREDGKWRWVRCRGKAVNRNEIGHPLRFSGTQTDITEYKQLEQQLLHAQKMDAVGRLAGGVAHDFNNVLTVIMSYSELVLLQVNGDKRLRTRVEEIRKAAEKAARLTRQLLMFSRSETVTPIMLDMNRLVVDIESMLERLIGEHIQLDIHLDPTIHAVKADPGQIEQVLLNLVVNARDAMPDGGIMHVATRRVEFHQQETLPHAEMQPGLYVELSVGDNGSGMNSETQKRIFEPFFTTKGPGKGTGLGLSTVFGIVKQNRGYIDVQSEVGEGTTFRIFFPCLPNKEYTLLPPPTAVFESEPGVETILLIEDEEQIRSLACNALEAVGYTVLPAANGEEALLLSSEHQGPIHLMVSDVVMPGMSGVKLSKQIMAQRPTTKILFMSGYTDGELNMRETMDEQQAFLHKPFTPALLAKTVRRLLDNEPLLQR